MVQFETERVREGLTRLYGMGGEQMYLVEGEKEAVLIDCGSGVGDLKAVIESLTALPVRVLLTHGHVDHASGASQFDQVYLSQYDWKLFETQTTVETRNLYLGSSPFFGELKESDYVPTMKTEHLQHLADGQLFDLGGITVEAVACPGHTQGSMMFLLQEWEILISGDACNFFTMLQCGEDCSGVYSYEKTLHSVMPRTDGRYTRILLSHGRREVPLTLLQEVAQVCEEIRLGTDDHVPFDFLGTSGYVAKAFYPGGKDAYARVDGAFGNIVYDAEKIWS